MTVTQISTSPAVELSQEDFFLLRDIIESRAGIYIERSLWDSLKDKVGIRLVQGHFSKFQEYCDYLITLDGEEEFQELLNAITVHETYFFRDSWQFDFIKRNIIPEIIQRKMALNCKRVVKIWSAGCSTGEEPYSIAIISSELEELLKDFRLEILATDVSSKALKKAKGGIYGKRSIREIPRGYLEKYFTRSGDEYHLHKEIKNVVTFFQLNLAQEPFPVKDMGEQDIVLCKNVLIYFNPDNVKKVLHNLYQCIDKKGYLFTGGAESLFHLSHEFQLRERKNVFYYTKGKVSPESSESPKELMVIPQPKIFPARLKDISPDRSSEKRPREENPLTTSLRYIRTGEYEEAKKILNIILKNNTNHTEALIFLGYIHTCLSEFEEAFSVCYDLLRTDPLSVESHFILGLIYKYKEETDNALTHFRKATYLQPNLPLAHYYLGELYLNKGDKFNAAKKYKNALTVFQNSMGEEEDILNSIYGETELRQILYICQQRLKTL